MDKRTAIVLTQKEKENDRDSGRKIILIYLYVGVRSGWKMFFYDSGLSFIL